MTVLVAAFDSIPTPMINLPAKAILIERTFEIGPSFSSTTLSSRPMPQTTPYSRKSRWDKAKMILCFKRPLYFPSPPILRAFQTQINALIDDTRPDALKILPAPSIDIPGSVSFDQMLNGMTVSVSAFSSVISRERTESVVLQPYIYLPFLCGLCGPLVNTTPAVSHRRLCGISKS